MFRRSPRVEDVCIEVGFCFNVGWNKFNDYTKKFFHIFKSFGKQLRLTRLFHPFQKLCVTQSPLSHSRVRLQAVAF